MTRTAAASALALLLGLAALPARAASDVSRAIAPNDLHVLVKPVPVTDVVAVELMLDLSALDEPAGKAGIRNLIQRLLLKGTTDPAGKAAAERLEGFGGWMGVSVGLDYVELYAITPADGFESAVAAMAAAVRFPALSPDEIGKQKGDALAEVLSPVSDHFHATYQAFRQTLYDGHPYALVTGGDWKSLTGMTRDDLVAFHARYYTPRQASLAICGGVTPGRAMRAVREAFGDWRPGPQTGHAAEPPPPLAGSSLTVRGLHVNQAYLVMGFPAPAVGEPGYYAVQVLDALLGGQPGSRLPRELRDKQRLVYEVSSFYPTLAQQSHLAIYAVTSPDGVEAAKTGILAVLEDVRGRPVPAAELEAAKRRLLANYTLSHQRMKDQAYALAWADVLERSGAPRGTPAGDGDFEARYLAGVQAVTPEEIQEAARSVLKRFVLAVSLPMDSPGSW